MLWTKYRPQILIAFSAAVLFIPFIGNVPLFDWDEANFAECAREMLETGQYFRTHINYLPFWEKPPLFMWLQAAGMHLFGISEFAARLPNAVCGVFTLVILYNLGKRLFDHAFGLIWVFAYGGSVLPHFYFRSGIIDPVLNLFVFLGMYYFILAVWKYDGDKVFKFKKSNGLVFLALSGLFVGLGILTKGPVALLIPGLCFAVYWVLVKLRMYITVPQFLVFLSAVLLTTGIWYGIETAINGPWFVTTFVEYQIRLFTKQDAGHAGFPGYHFVILFFGCFPASVFTLRALFKQNLDYAFQTDFKVWMKIMMWVILILFTVVRTKIVHYSSMAYFPITFLGSVTIYQLYQERQQFKGWMKWAIGVIGGILALPTLILPMLVANIDQIKPMIKDKFARANFDAEVYWSGFESLVGVFYIGVLIVFFIWGKKSRQQAFFLLFGGTALYLTLTLYAYIGRIERYVQHSLIEFLEERQGEDCYIMTRGFKSYAYLFYSRTRPNTQPPSGKGYDDKEVWKRHLLYDEIAKDVYIITKVQHQNKVQDIAGIEKLYEKNGFAFFKRAKTKS